VARRTITVEKSDGTRLCAECRVAASPWMRMRGLLGRKQLSEREGLLIRRTRSVHTHFMRFPIDVLFLDGDNTVVKIVEGLRPWRVASSRRGRDVLELAAGTCRRIGASEGDRLFVVEAT
jgi:uncharacterized membrane protein (UPF0127 family)